mgnify:CR=1 FL=1
MRGGGTLAKRFFDDELSKISIARTNSPVRRVVEEETSVQPHGIAPVGTRLEGAETRESSV